jgi:tetratricopeptide (TPR) repeat protein
MLSFLMPNTLQFGKVTALRVQDLMVFDIIFSSQWARPIYFAMTVSDDGKIGLKDYMRMEGLAFRFTPRKAAFYWQNIDEPKLRTHVFTDVETPSKELQPGFRWRGMSDSTVYFDEDCRRLVMNYRQTFVALGYYYAYVLNQPEKFADVLDRLEQVIPRRIISLPTVMKFDFSRFYSAAGRTAQTKELLQEAADEWQKLVDGGDVPRLSQDNPYLLLAETYEILEEYDKAIAVVDKIGQVYATERGVDQFVRDRKTALEARKKASAAPDSTTRADSTSRPR